MPAPPSTAAYSLDGEVYAHRNGRRYRVVEAGDDFDLVLDDPPYEWKDPIPDVQECHLLYRRPDRKWLASLVPGNGRWSVMMANADGDPTDTGTTFAQDQVDAARRYVESKLENV